MKILWFLLDFNESIRFYGQLRRIFRLVFGGVCNVRDSLTDKDFAEDLEDFINVEVYLIVKP